MPPRGYDEAPMFARIEAHMAENPGVSRHAAIKRLAGEVNVRRIEMKMTAAAIRRIADLRKAVIAEHAVRHPVVLASNGGRFTLLVVSPFDGENVDTGLSAGLFTCSGMAFGSGSRHGERGSVGFHVAAGARSAGDWNFSHMEWAATSAGLVDAMDALGLSLRDVDGVLRSDAGAPGMTVRLARALCEAWREAGVEEAGDMGEAVELETARLADGRGGAAAQVPCEARRFAAAYGGEWFAERRGDDQGIDSARMSLLVSLAAFAHPALVTMSDDDVLKWSGRPVECLEQHLNERILPAVEIGRRIELSDAGWLMGVFGARSVPPLGSRLLELLLRWQDRVDPARIATDEDAAGLIAMMNALLERDPWGTRRDLVDEDLRLLFARLQDGRNAVRSYGEIAEALRKTAQETAGGARDSGTGENGLTPFAAVVVAATVGVERLCDKVAHELLLPTLVWDCVARSGGDQPGIGDELAGLLAPGGPWSARVEDDVRDMTAGGRRIEEAVVAVRSAGMDRDLDAPYTFRLETSRVRDAVKQ